MKKNLLRLSIIAVVAVLSSALLFPQKIIHAVPVTALKDQLSSAQLSYFARLGVGNTVGNSIININTTTGAAPSNSNDNLFIGDTVAIANSPALGSTQYVVRDIAGTNAIFIDPGLDVGNTKIGSYVVATQSAVHTISFSPESSVTSGKWQVLLKATNISSENPADGMPDQGGFDLNGLTNSDVTCPWGATASVGTTVILTTGMSVGSTGPYHLITCALPVGNGNPSGTGETGTIVIGSTHQLINPAPGISHVVGQANASADTYTFLVRHTYADNSLIDNDTTIGKIALTESVQVTAVIDPTITFYLDSINVSSVGTTRCGTPLSAGAPQTTATTVNFGSLSLGQFNTLAQRFSCSTNALDGYIVQVYEDKPLTITSVGSNTNIPDTTCDSGCDLDTPNGWNTNTSNSQFGYSLQEINSSPVAFTYSDNGGFNAKPFGIGFSNSRTIMSRGTTPAAEDQAYICYRITASNFQEAGTYQNKVNFIATATF
jgi:hypothetical protein